MRFYNRYIARRYYISSILSNFTISLNCTIITCVKRTYILIYLRIWKIRTFWRNWNILIINDISFLLYNLFFIFSSKNNIFINLKFSGKEDQPTNLYPSCGITSGIIAEDIISPSGNSNINLQSDHL